MIKVNAGNDVKRTDLLMVDPCQIIIDESMRGRREPLPAEKIVEYAISMMSPTGQLNPVQCRRVEEQKLQLCAGFSRHAAAILIRKGFTHNDVKYHDPKFLLKTTVADMNEEAAFKANIIENAQRSSTNAVDDAFNQQHLRDKYGYNDADIARLYGQDPSRVSRLHKILTLDAKTQKLIATGDMTFSSALDLCDLPEADREKVVKESIKSGKVDHRAVRSAAREHANKKDTNAKKKGRSLVEVRDFFQWHSETTKVEASKEFAEAVLSYIAGKKSDANLTKLLDEAFGK